MVIDTNAVIQRSREEDEISRNITAVTPIEFSSIPDYGKSHIHPEDQTSAIRLWKYWI